MQSDQFPSPPPIYGLHRAAQRTGRSVRPHDVLAILISWALSACLSLFVQPHYHETSTYELVYYTFYNVAAGALVGFYLFDRLPKDGFALFAVRAASTLLFGTLMNETVVEDLAFGAGPINGVGVYYGLTDSLSWSAIFLLLRLAQWLQVVPQRVHPERQMPVIKPADPDAGCLFVRVANGTQRIHAPDILYMEAQRDFTRIVCANGEHFVSENLKGLLEKSAELGLIRVHKSFAVNLRRVERLTRAEVLLGDRRVPVGRRYRPAFIEIWRA